MISKKVFYSVSFSAIIFFCASSALAAGCRVGEPQSGFSSFWIRSLPLPKKWPRFGASVALATAPDRIPAAG